MSDEVAGTRVLVIDLIVEAWRTLGENRLRSVVSALAVAFAAAAVVTVNTVNDSGARVVSSEFDALRATTITVTPQAPYRLDQRFFPDDTEARLRALSGVASAGIIVRPDRRVAVTNSTLEAAVPADLFGADAGIIEALGHRLDPAQAAAFALGARVVVLGANVAADLGVDPKPDSAEPRYVALDGVIHQLVGVVTDPDRLRTASSAVLVPRRSLPSSLEIEPERQSVVIATMSGAADQVARQVSPALSPDHERPYTIDVPASPESFRQRIETNVAVLAVVMAGIAAAVGAVSISATTYSSIAERTAELGLRRALGAKPRHLGTMVLTESTMLGAISGLSGVVIGLVVSAAIAAPRGWPLIVNPLGIALVPLVAMALGALAGTVPAFRAIKIDPSAALRSS